MSKTSLTFIIFIAFFPFLSVFSQNQDNCFKDYQLLRMQKEGRNSIASFLKKEGFDLSNESLKKDQMTFGSFEYDQSYIWKNYYTHQQVYLVVKKGFPNVIYYYLPRSYSCYSSLKESILGKANERVTLRGVSYIFKDDGVTVYNSAKLEQKENQKERKIQEAKEKIGGVMYDFEKIILKGDSLLDKGLYDLAKSEFLTAQKKSASYIDLYKENFQLLNNDYNVIDNFPSSDYFVEILESKFELCKMGIIDAKFNKIVQYGDSLFGIGNYVEAIEIYETSREFDNYNVVDSKIIRSKEAKTNILTNLADAALLIGDFNGALVYLQKAIIYANNRYLIENKIVSVTNKRLAFNLNAIENTGDSLFSIGNYEIAIRTFEKYLMLDPNSEKIKGKMKKAYEIKNILYARKEKIFSYKKTNNKDFYKIKDKLTNELKLIVSEKDKGIIKLDFSIEFDTLGNNNSSVIIERNSINGLQTKLNSYAKDNVLIPPSKINKFYIASKEKLSFDMNWITFSNTFKSTSKGVTSTNKNLSQTNLNMISNYLRQYPESKGKFIFDIKEKEISGNTYTDINLMKYKVARPRAAIYSLIMPGMGTLKVSYGEKGWARFTCFLLSSVVSASSKVYSDMNYQKYLNSTNPEEMTKFYDQANIAHKLFLTTAGISATVYTYDFFWVISRGVKNLKQSKNFRRKLRQSPISIQNQEGNFIKIN